MSTRTNKRRAQARKSNGAKRAKPTPTQLDTTQPTHSETAAVPEAAAEAAPEADGEPAVAAENKKQAAEAIVESATETEATAEPQSAAEAQPTTAEIVPTEPLPPPAAAAAQSAEQEKPATAAALAAVTEEPSAKEAAADAEPVRPVQRGASVPNICASQQNPRRSASLPPSLPSGARVTELVVPKDSTCDECTLDENTLELSQCARCNASSHPPLTTLRGRGNLVFADEITSMIRGEKFTMGTAKYEADEHGFGAGVQRSQPGCNDANCATILTVYKTRLNGHNPMIIEAPLVNGTLGALVFRRLDKCVSTGRYISPSQWRLFQDLDRAVVWEAIVKYHNLDLRRVSEQSTGSPAVLTPTRTRQGITGNSFAG
jgi:hypothetical protein